MSTIPKPTAILEEAEKRFPSKGRFDLLRKQGFIDGAMYAATTPTDGREELEKDIVGLKEMVSSGLNSCEQFQSSLKEKEDQYSELETKYEDNKAHGEQLRDEALRWYNQLKEKEKRVIELEKFAQRVATGQMGELKGTFIIHVMNEAKKLLHEGN